MGKQSVFAFYWAICGGLVGIGLVSWVGPPFLLLAGIMFLYGRLRVGSQGSWGFFLGFGLLPGFLIFYGDRLYGGCTTAGSRDWGLPAIIPDRPGGTYVPCGAIPESSLDIAVFFFGVALLGIIGMLIRHRRRAINHS